MTLPPGFTILALETSCDETAAAIVRDGRVLLSNVVASQLAMHQRYGGVVPEVASRQHILSIAPVLQEALAVLPGGWDDLHAVAATYGPGLSGALLTGLNAAKAAAWQRGLPFVGVNHLEGHIYANWLNVEENHQPPQFPLVALIVSGGHTILVLMRDHGDYLVLGQTRDDAAGEAFDKVARILNLGYPGGPAIQQAAEGTQGSEKLPRAWLRDTYDFSFSGLKTAVLHKAQEHQARNNGAFAGNFAAEIARAFQDSVVDVLVSKTISAAMHHKAAEIVLAGGVAANRPLRNALKRLAGIPVRCPPIWLCTDNAAMIAAAAYYRFDSGVQSGWGLDVQPGLPLNNPTLSM